MDAAATVTVTGQFPVITGKDVHGTNFTINGKLLPVPADAEEKQLYQLFAACLHYEVYTKETMPNYAGPQTVLAEFMSNDDVIIKASGVADKVFWGWANVVEGTWHKIA